jgi:Flp pilus assembly protein TadD
MFIDPNIKREEMPMRGAIWPLLLRAGLTSATLCGGCVHAPRQASAPGPASPPAPPPPAARDATPMVSVDLNRTAGENTTFHKTATERQKFQVHLDFGKVFEAQGNLDRAVQEYQDALKVAEARGHGQLNAADEALAHRRLASALDRLGQFPQAEPHYKKAQKLAPKDAKVWNDAGYSYYVQGRWAEAERALRTAMKLAPDDSRVRTNLGMTLAAAGKTAVAMPLLSDNQGDAIGHANLGFLLASTGQYERARKEYQIAVKMRPDLDRAHRALAQLDRQERGATAPPTMIARNASKVPGSVDPQVTTASAPATDEILLPPMPPLPPPVATPKLPSRALP